MYFYNTLTKRKEEFIPLKDDTVGMYVCGITPYDSTHLGHARCYVVFDALRRFLKTVYKVKYVQNFTDIDDKIIAKSRSENVDWKEVSSKFIREYYRDIRRLGVEDADFAPKVSENIPEVIQAVAKLIENGFAYVLDGDVYYRVAKFRNYGRLSGRKTEELLPGARVEPDKRKESSLDFALWKKSVDDEPGWKSPWGRGRPGWHIECSVMSMKFIGETLDIHGGGQDLIFPHHENEIAQSEALTGKIFSRFWLHNGFVTVKNEKMSKSLKNFFRLADVLEKFSPSAIRFYLLSQHYRKPLDFSVSSLEEAEKNVERITRVLEEPAGAVVSKAEKDEADRIYEDFIAALCDDFNTPVAYSHFFSMLKLFNRSRLGYIKGRIEEMDKILNFLNLEKKDKKSPLPESEILRRINQRASARKSGDFGTADRIRDELLKKGIILEDTLRGTKWRVK
ncbi:MAG: cysteine--tRNA ligase [Elusimicrobia bacterium]|nr:cysteine--tRNA ligase [Elusimicrobiota bacterium]